MGGQAGDTRWILTLERGLSLAMGVQILVMSRWWARHDGVACNQRMLQEGRPCLLKFLRALAARRCAALRWIRAGLWGTALWGILMNVVSKAFYEQHLLWLAQPQPQIIWSWRHMEPLMYISWHGAGGSSSWDTGDGGSGVERSSVELEDHLPGHRIRKMAAVNRCASQKYLMARGELRERM